MANLLPSNGNIQLAVVTGGHPFEVPPFMELFRSLAGVDFYPQSPDEFTADADQAAAYDVVLFYHWHKFARDAELPWYQANAFTTLEQLGRAGQGILVLHHALVAFPDWPLWSELVGIEERHDNGWDMNQRIPIEVADTEHPITRGVTNWTLPDESYMIDSPRPGDGNHILLTTTHEKSMREIAWTRTFRDSRVFCWQSGHGREAFEDEGFRRVLGNAVGWLAEDNDN